MEYNVKSGERIATVTLDGTECAVKFGSRCNVFFIKNNSSAPVLVSLVSGAVKGDDGTVFLASGESFCYPHMRQLDTVYLTGSGECFAEARNHTGILFAGAASAGSGGGDIENAELIAYALNEAGYAVTDDPSTWGAAVESKFMAYDYRLDYSGTIFVCSGKTVTRSTDKLAYCGWFGGSNTRFAPVVIGADAESAAFNMNGIVISGNRSFEGDGETVYYATAIQNGIIGEDTSAYNRRYFGSSATGEAMARKLYNEIKMLGFSLYE